MFLGKNFKYKDILICLLIGVIGYKLIDNYSVFFDLIKKLLSIVSPFIYALIFAYILNPVMNLFEKKLKMKRGLAILLTYVIITGLIGIAFVYVVPSIVDSIISITADVPKYMEVVQGWINNSLKNENVYELIKDSGLLDYVSVISSKVGTIMVGMLEGSITSIVSITTNLVKVGFGFLIAIYVLLDKESFIKESKTFIYMIFKEHRGSKIIEWIRTYNKMIGLYIGTKAIDSAIIGFMALIGLLIIKAPYAILIALIVGITNMIPYFGPLVGELVGAVIGIFVSPMMAIMIFLFLLALQQFDAWYLDPKLIGEKVGVKPFYIILAVMIGGGYFGAIGMLLASPTMATINIFYERKVSYFKEKNKVLIKRIEEEDKIDKVEEDEKGEA
ncbi:AI-2E family transporter [Clostridium paraputrificum]|uniref:AI-2E family transporter n=1 Tax=Clostridium TaxID=1485 RepID=UPI003D3572B7